MPHNCLSNYISDVENISRSYYEGFKKRSVIINKVEQSKPMLITGVLVS